MEAGRFASHSNIVGDQQEDSIILSVDHRFSIDGQGRPLLQTEIEQRGVIDPILALAGLIAQGDYVLAQDVALSVNPASRQHLADQSLYQGYFIAGSHQPQQLVLQRDGRMLGEAHLLLDLNGLSPERVQQLFDAFKAYLYGRFGSPNLERSAGHFASSLRQDVQNGVLVRVMEWQVGGSTIRFGLPKTLEGQPRLQISLKDQFSSALEGIWAG